MDSPLALGGYMLVQASGFKYERETLTAAIEALDIISSVIGQPATA